MLLRNKEYLRISFRHKPVWCDIVQRIEVTGRGTLNEF